MPDVASIVRRVTDGLPLWARVADAFVLVLLFAALFVTMTGGAVFRVGSLAVSVTSSLRLLVWAGGILCVRHFVVRRHPFPLRIIRRVWSAARAAGPLREDPELPPVAGRTSWGNSSQAVAVAAIVYVAATVVMTYPQARLLADTVVPEFGDPLLSTWRLSWVAHQLPRDPLHLFDGNIFHPERYTLAFSDAMIVPSLMVAPLVWLGVHQVIAYNVLLLSAFVLSGLGMFILVRSLTHHFGAALVAGLVFAFLPYRFLHYHHVELLMAQWMPLCLWALHRTVAHGRLSDGILAGAFFTLQMLSSLYYGIFFATYLALVVPILLTGAGRRKAVTAFKPLVAGCLLAVLLIAPFAIPYLGARRIVGERRSEEVHIYSATPQNYLAAPYHNMMFGLPSWRQKLGGPERDLFQGITAPLIAIVGLWPPLSTARIAYVLGGILAFETSLGVNGYVYPFLHRFAFPYRGLRVPARMAILVGLSLAILLGFAAARIVAVCSRPWLVGATLTTISAGILLEYATTVKLRPVWSAPPSVYGALPPSTRVIFELPLVEPDTVLEPVYMYFSTFHWHKLVNGYSGFSPPSHQQLWDLMPAFPDDAGMAELRRREVDAIVIHGAFHREQEAYQALVAALDARRDVVLVRTVTWEGYESRVYRVMK